LEHYDLLIYIKYFTVDALFWCQQQCYYLTFLALLYGNNSIRQDL